MSNEPEKSLDELLKAYAQKRRTEAGAPPEMPSATRRLLQAEVSRTFRKQGQASSWFAELSGLWPRLAWGGSILAVLVVGSLVLFRPQKTRPDRFELAHQKTEESLSRVQEKSVREAASPAQPDSTRGNDVFFNANGVSPEKKATPALAERSTPLLTERIEEKSKIARSDAVAVSAAPPAAPAVSQALAPLPSSAPRNEQPGEPAMKRYGLTLQDNAQSPRPPQPLLSAPAVPEKPAAAAPANVTANTEAKAADKSSAGAAGLAQLRESKPVAGTPPATLPILTKAAPDRADSTASNISQPENKPASLVTAAPPVATPMPTSANAANYAFAPNVEARGLADSQPNAARLYFSQAAVRARYRQNFNSPPMPNVLQTFEIQRDHANVRVIDADGSIYEGAIQSAATPVGEDRAASRRRASINQLEQEKEKTQTATARSDESSRPGIDPSVSGDIESFAFQAIGTNRSLNQRVVFTGNFQAATKAVFASPGGRLGRGDFGGGGDGNQTQALSKAPALSGPRPNQTTASRAAQSPQIGLQGGTSPAAPPSLLRSQSSGVTNGHIEGKAVIGGGKELKIDAIQINR